MGIVVHTDDTCSALETFFSDSGLHKFTFYIHIYHVGMLQNMPYNSTQLNSPPKVAIARKKAQCKLMYIPDS